MVPYIIRRLLSACIFIIIGCIIVFSLIHLIPGDPVKLILGSRYAEPSEEAIAGLRHELGLDKSLVSQYLSWFYNLIKLDLGKSVHYKVAIRSLVFKRLARTLELIVFSIALSIMIAIPLGIIAGTNRGTVIDTITSSSAVLGLSTPVFVVGILLILFCSIALKILPSGGFADIIDNPIKHFQCIILPTLSLSAATVGTTTRMTRAAIIEVLKKDYVRTAFAKGLSYRRVIIRHVLRNSLIPIVTMLGIRFGALLGGTVIVEAVFAYPGFSTLLVTAVYHRDYPLIQAVLLIIMICFVLINLIVDIINLFVDPRISHN